MAAGEATGYSGCLGHRLPGMLVSPPLQRFIDGFIDDLTPGLREVAEAAHRTLCTAGHPACSALPREAVGEAADLFARRRLRWVEAMLQALRFEASHAAIDGSAATAPDPAEPSTPMDQWSLVDEDQAMIWRGPMATQALERMLAYFQ